MSDPTVYYETEHWKVTDCVDDPGERIHIYVKHDGLSFPECWTKNALTELNLTLEGALKVLEKG